MSKQVIESMLCRVNTINIKGKSLKRACEILAEYGMKTDPNKLGLGLQQRVYPFGVAIQCGRWVYEIYENLLMDWIRERAG